MTIANNINVLLFLTRVWIQAISHDGDNPSYMIARVAQHQTRPALDADTHRHHNVLLLDRVSRGLGPHTIPKIITDVIDALFARNEESFDGQFGEELEAETDACVFSGSYRWPVPE